MVNERMANERIKIFTHLLIHNSQFFHMGARINIEKRFRVILFTHLLNRSFTH
jgi:hypothetical protein